MEAARSAAVAAKENTLVEKLREQEREAKRRLRDDEAEAPVSPREWLSGTADTTVAEVEAMTIKEKRLPIRQTVLRRRSALGVSISFEAFVDRVHSLKAPKVSNPTPRIAITTAACVAATA